MRYIVKGHANYHMIFKNKFVSSDENLTSSLGHSLGAHVMGNVKHFGSFKLDRISGMDPAGPCFEGKAGDIRIKDREWGLTKSSAKFVDNIHTDGKYYGTRRSNGHVDFFTGQFLGLRTIFYLRFHIQNRGVCNSKHLHHPSNTKAKFTWSTYGQLESYGRLIRKFP